jgi:hypothetical protein
VSNGSTLRRRGRERGCGEIWRFLSRWSSNVLLLRLRAGPKAVPGPYSRPGWVIDREGPSAPQAMTVRA